MRVAIGVAAATAIASCSGTNSTSSPIAGPAAGQSPASNSATNGASGVVASPTITVGQAARLVIDGQDQNLHGPQAMVVCTRADGTIKIQFGIAMLSPGAQLTDTNPPVVQWVSIGRLNGVDFDYEQDRKDGSAQAASSGNSYTITGTAIGFEDATSMQPTAKSFEMNATCPSQ